MGDTGTATLLVHMPVAARSYPNLAVELLAASARRAGYHCDILYGTRFYQPCLNINRVPIEFDQGVFAHAYRGIEIATLADTLAAQHPDRSLDRDALYLEALTAIDCADRCLEQCRQAVVAGHYGIVGFSVGFDQQKLASLALARSVKASDPSICIIFGGTGCDGALGDALLRNFPEVDLVAQGDADTWFPDLIGAIQRGAPLERFSVLSRNGGGVSRGAPMRVTRHLDALPPPDYRAFFRQMDGGQSENSAPRIVLLEASRGCWWGDKQRCMFCGISSVLSGYREKSAEKFLAEFLSIVEAAQPTYIFMTDSILPLSYYRTVLPELARWRRETKSDLRIYFEIKSNVTRRQMALLAAAGVVDIQPGIESFSSRILHLMNKGVGMLKQVELLKWARTYGLNVITNLIYGIPREQVQDYEEILRVISALHHLQPPYCQRMRYFKFCRYSEAPEQYGLGNLRPFDRDRCAFGLPDQELKELCYELDYDYLGEQARELAAMHARLRKAMQAWFNDYWFHARSLWLNDLPDKVVITEMAADTRPRIIMLGGLEAEVYRRAASAKSLGAIARECATQVEEIRDIASRFAGDGIALEEDGYLLALATPRKADAWTDAGLADGSASDDELLAISQCCPPAYRGG